MAIWEPLEEMYERAKEGKLWFYSTYQSLWFSPERLAEENENGSFRWGPCNWILRDPNEQVKELAIEISRLQKQMKSVQREIDEYNKMDKRRTTSI